MPVRCSSLPTGVRLALFNRSSPSSSRQQQQQHGFHTTSPLRHDAAAIDRSRNHYETLNLAPGATPAEIKKSFYSLSKTHHPDLNRADPDSSKRFMRISEAYGTLSSTEKRTKYDRDVLGLHRGGSAHPSGSFSSANPAGGRPATGLSRRRTVFRGPPPSFYRSGGWGAHEAKRSAAQEESTGGASSGNARARDHHNDGSWINENMGGAAGGSASSGFGFGADTGGMGPGQDPFHRGDVPHFDRESHEKTQRNTEAHRTRSWRMRMGGRDRIEIETDRGPGGMFFVIGGVLLISFMGPYLFSRSWSEKGKKRGTARS